MSVRPAPSPRCEQPGDEDDGAIERMLDPRRRDIGGLPVRRLLPVRQARSVGPFVFFDEMGPVELPAPSGADVPPHPHIGLATVTYLFEGAALHKDSLGTTQLIEPGDVNWMSAGKGIVHSERIPAELHQEQATLHGVQTWVALPPDAEDSDPFFEHCSVDMLPEFEQDGARVRLLAGQAYGRSAPVVGPSPLFYSFATLQAGAHLRLPDEHAERAVFSVDGGLTCNGASIPAHSLALLATGKSVVLHASTDTRVLCFGGQPLEERRFMEWNFVSTRRERIERAKADWKQGRFQLIEGDPERVPLPEENDT